ncbi:hypothetical protein BV25DRAFT_1920344 [Artomyces pyxidatus]|uniref:Uncharacterized protein n=1 Tax=Artomyces pyxidatus TaxID=48021 RepID=A0ACB8SNE4_9AGAM|nr:hypothetical protein BV25DRAFT_1920344 [Artomyces pyxidatus]
MDRFPPDPSLPAPHNDRPLDPSMPPPAPPATSKEDSFNFAFLKGPKRKRLAKACDACHKSKRRCDGTAPCSNCYFATKDCTYTDAAGRSVPAPRSSKSEKGSEPRRRPKNQRHPSPVPSSPSTSRARADPMDDSPEARKRQRIDSSSSSFQTPEPQAQPAFSPRASAPSTFPASRLDVPVVRELVNLFFAHCHPQRLVLHQPSFCAALSHGSIPTYLLYALCACAAPLSRQPVVFTKPPRIAGNPYATEAIGQMFDKSGRLTVERNLATVQALCLLQSHELLTAWPWTSSTKYFELALSILEEDVHVHTLSTPIPTPMPTPDFAFDAIDRECARRAFWFIHFMSLTTFTYYNVPVPTKPLDLTLRLPVDETSFEFGVHTTVPEYLHVPAPRTQFASEYGHLIRIASLHAHMEATMHTGDASALERAVQDTERALSTWDASLSDQIRFGEESAQLQIAMFETGSNAGAWCYFMMHILHASCILALCDAKFRMSGVTAPECRQWARERMMLIVSSLGNRAKNSSLLVAVLLALQKHDLADHPQIQTWTRDHEETWGMKLPSAAVARASPSTMSTAPSPLPQPPSSASQPSSATAASSAQDYAIHDDADRSETSSATSYRSFGRLHLSDRTPPPQPPHLQLQTQLRDTGPPVHIQAPATSLPSLKACGLLDSWSEGTNGNGTSPSEGTARLPPPPWKTLLAQGSALKSTSSSGPPQPPSPKDLVLPPPPPGADAPRAGMPVGLHWLENER